jgi:ABC-2 type transport system ATP-binding protein
MIEVDKLTKSFFVHKKEAGLLGSVRSLFKREKIEKVAVSEVSFRIGEGEIVGLVGANGAGKTTLVKMLAGIIFPTRGDARVLGYRPWERNDDLRRQIALIMGQKAQLWWDLPAADCFLLLREIYRIPKQRFDASLGALVELLDVKEQLNIQIRRLSLGERMKMELIAALLHSPRVVYLDEPTIGLDITTQRSIREFILRYQSERRPAMILTSHYMEDIERLCRRIMIIRDGTIVYDGSLQEVVTAHAQHKVVTARLPEGTEPWANRAELEKLGEVKECTDASVKIHVPRANVAQAAARLVNLTNARDLSVEEEDIGTIIESIMQAREKEPQ